MTDTREQTRTAGTQMEDGSNAGKELAPVRQQRMTVAQEREHGRAKLIAAVETRQAEIGAFLKPFGVSWDFFLSCLRVAMMKIAKDDGEFLTTVTPSSFLEAALRCAMNGLLPDGKEAAIARFKDVATFMPMKEGLIKVMHRTGYVKDINAEVVTKREDELGRFEYEEGSTGYIKHRPMLDRAEETDEVVAAYCVVRTINGGEYREVVNKADLAKIAKVSRATKGPRVDWKWRMDLKAAIRRVAQLLPKDEGLARILAHDDDNYDLTLAEAPPRESAIPKAQLFGSKAHVKAKPALEAPAAPEEPPVNGQDEPGAAQEPESHPDVLRLVTAIRACEDLPTLIDLIHEAGGVECSGEEREWLTETADATRARLMPPLDDIERESPLAGGEVAPSEEDSGRRDAVDIVEAGTDGSLQPDGEEGAVSSAASSESPFRLLAIISSATGLRPYDSPKLWAGDLLNKLAAVRGEALHAFWNKNFQHIMDAREHFPEDAQRVLDVAHGKGLKIGREA